MDLQNFVQSLQTWTNILSRLLGSERAEPLQVPDQGPSDSSTAEEPVADLLRTTAQDTEHQNEEEADFGEYCDTVEDDPSDDEDEEEAFLDYVIYLFDQGCTIKNMATICGTPLRTMERFCARHGLRARERFSSVTDEQLDAAVRLELSSAPHIGVHMLKGRLALRNIFVPRRRLREAYARAGAAGAPVSQIRIRRRQYSVRGPLSLWHIDGNHKLVRWGFYIHGGIDGFSRLVVYLGIAGNNRAETVVKLFLEAINSHGVPVSVRADHGGENVDVGRLIRQLRNSERSFITGKSVHNTRIERLWRDVFQSCTGHFYNLFWTLEDSGSLDPDNEVDITVLHYCFLHVVQNSLTEFKLSWNLHQIRNAHSKTPNQMFQEGLHQLRELAERQNTMVEELLQPTGLVSITEDFYVEGRDERTTPLESPIVNVLRSIQPQEVINFNNASATYCRLRDYMRRNIAPAQMQV